MLISIDTETTGVDLAHGAMPFLVTTCDNRRAPDSIKFWQWPVDPITRRPAIPQGDVGAVQELLDQAELVYLQNSKFDARALKNIGVELPWAKVRDTLVAAHLLCSNGSTSEHKKDLTSLCRAYLGRDIEKWEIKVKEVTKAARAIVKKRYPHWRIAREGDGDMPSVRDSSKRDEDKPWKADMWIVQALYAEDPGSIPHAVHEEWLRACPNYANTDSEYTLYLGLQMERLIEQRGYWAHYLHRLQLMRADCEMEEYGVTVIGEYTERTIDEYERYGAAAGAELVQIAAEYGHDLELAQGAALNDNMRDFFYGAQHLTCPRCSYRKRIKHWNGEEPNKYSNACPKCQKGGRNRQPVLSPLQTYSVPNLDLPVIESAKSGNASLDKNAMQEYLGTLEGEALDFIKLLLDKRKHDTDLGYMHQYQRYWAPVPGCTDYYRIHPFINPCGTDHLRQSCNSPNLQNVGGQEDKCDECDGHGCDLCGGTGKTRRSVKYCFGPAPGREWYSADYKSIEARLPGYRANEPKQIEVFDKPNDPPYWGNLYNLTASVLYPDEYWPVAQDEGRFRKDYPKLYKKAKFFVLAKNYGAGRKKGDLLSGIKNSYDLVDSEFPMLAALQREILSIANRTGWIHTMPTRAINPRMGYPLMASRTEDNYVLSTTPFNYYISGTACECKNLALVRCTEQCKQWQLEGFDAHVSLEIHDEFIFDFPRGKTQDANLGRAYKLRELMEQSGEDLVPRIPTPVKLEYHSVTWAEGVEV